MPTFGRPRIATRIASSPTDGTCLADVLEPGDHLVEQVAGAVAVHSGERDRVAEAEAVQLERERLLRRVVDLVREHEHGLPGEAKDLGQLLVAGHHAGAGVGDEQDEVGLLDREARLVDDRAGHLVLAHDVDAAGVDQQELLAGPLADELLAVAGGAARLVDDSRSARGQPVDQRRLADVREPDDRHGAEQVGHRDVGQLARVARVTHSGGVSPLGRPRACTSASQSKRTFRRRSISALASL